MDSVIIIDLIKGISTPWPRLETDEYVMSAGSARPLEDAFRIAQLDLVQWISRDWGLSELDAYQLLSQTVESPLANPGNVDFVVVREGTEGPYVGNGGVIRRGTEFEIATEVSINTAHGVERRHRGADPGAGGTGDRSALGQ